MRGVLVGEPKTLTLYNRLRDDLIAGRYEAGERLSENQVAEQYGVSRTPVREVFARLEVEGLVGRIGQVVSVFAPTIEQVLDLLDARILLEAAIARYAAERRNEADVLMLASATDACAALDAGADPTALLHADRAFHEVLGRAGHNPVLADLQRQLDMRAATLRASTLTADGRWAAVAEQHRRITVAVTERNGEAAAQAAADHLRLGRELWLTLQSRPVALVSDL
jgi:DNA-binding GntR family transcriptional regulator